MKSNGFPGVPRRVFFCALFGGNGEVKLPWRFVMKGTSGTSKYLWPALVLLASAMWGSSFVASKICINYGMLAFETIFYRFFFGSLLTALIFHRQLRHLTRRAVAAGVILGLCNALTCVTEIYGLAGTDASKASFLMSINIVLFPLLYCAFYRRRPKLHTLASAALAMAGVGLLSLTNGFGPLSSGDLLMIVTGFLYAVTSLVMVVWSKNESGVQVTLIQFLVVAGVMGVMALFQGSGGPFPVPAIAAAAFLVLFPTVICFLIKIESLKHIDPILQTLLLATESIFCTVISVLLLHERLTLRALIGAALISGGIVIESLHPVEQPSAPPPAQACPCPPEAAAPAAAEKPRQ